MKPTLLALFCLLLAGSSRAQSTPDAIVAEGKKLYRLEMSSWYGTDIFLAKLGNHKEQLGGYFSYRDNARTACLFFTKDEVPKTLAVISFDSTYDLNAALIDSLPRPLTSQELTLHAIRQRAKQAVQTDTLFKHFTKSNLNIIPLAEGPDKKVYVLTGPNVPGVVLFGNDYLLDFNSANQLTATHRLHHNLIPFPYSKDKAPDKAGIHSHLATTGDYITATDICTLMLYEKFAGWQQYYVMSKNYISIWDCQKNSLFVMTRKAWDRIDEDQKKRHLTAEKP